MVSSYYLGKPVTKRGHLSCRDTLAWIQRCPSSQVLLYFHPFLTCVFLFMQVLCIFFSYCTLPHIFSLIDNLAWEFYFYIYIFVYLYLNMASTKPSNFVPTLWTKMTRKRLLSWVSALLECLPEIFGSQPINRAPKRVCYWVPIYL